MTRSGRNSLGEGPLLSWDSRTADAEYLEDLVKNRAFAASAAPKQVWSDHPQFMKYKLESFRTALNKLKKKYGYHLRDGPKEQDSKVTSKEESFNPLEDVEDDADDDLPPGSGFFGKKKAPGAPGKSWYVIKIGDFLVPT